MESSSKMEEYRPPSTKIAFSSDKIYHVFLSFRGPDVRKTLVDHLYEALSAAGLNVFLDSEKLEKGEMIELSLERAMEGSAIRIPIFSEGYADSVWCLKEAAAMLSTPGLIIPLFYYVDPTHVRYPQTESSPYTKSFAKHYGRPDRYPTEDVDKWKDALRQICEFSGWSMDLTQGFEARLVKKVVYDLIKTLDRVPLEVAKHPVGIDSIKNALVEELHLNSVNKVVKLGICGIGGIGKTTIAKALYNQIYADFEAASVVFNVRTTAADSKGLRDLQRKILKDLCKYGGDVDSVEEGKSLLRDRLGGKRVLLIVDDVDADEQLHALVGDWLALGSRVIITSRDKHVLNLAQVQSIREISGLEINKGHELFSWHTFLRACPSPKYEDLSRRIVEACKGHPLSLEVIGSFLYDKKDDTGCWTEAFHNITLHPDIHRRLKISYDCLSDEEKEIFLDIACFFIGEKTTHPIVFWKSLYKMVDTAIFNLSMKSLIKIDDEGLFDMHDHLRDMGRIIAETEKEGTRLWEATHLSTLYNNTNFSRLRLNASSPQNHEMIYSPGLRYLHLQNVHIEGMMAMIPPSLIWLRLEDCIFAIWMDRAVKKPRHSRFLDNIWGAIGMDRAVKKPRHSRFLDNIWQLKIMKANGYRYLDSLSLSSLFSLPNIQLQHLDLSYCTGLNVLPDTIGNLSQLQHLRLTYCMGLNVLSDSIGNLSQLQHLDLDSCFGLNTLSHSIGNLSQLQCLDLSCCLELNVLPDSIGNLSQLQLLDLSCCSGLNVLPDTIGNLSQLQHLDLSCCSGLNVLPDNIGNLSQLQHLSLTYCTGLNVLSDTIGNLSQLQHLDLSSCRG
ncbi:disease resistance protein RUN1 [Cryptomeria japonica]|uniref:disease resistance protein RUN1 n=1 Tax=Cryptomeria japonica TaxID=3369 RepID=UPI0027D9FF8B|nr:disease resistance protein RUN1 [Cryptomeria japonica]